MDLGYLEITFICIKCVLFTKIPLWVEPHGDSQVFHIHHLYSSQQPYPEVRHLHHILCLKTLRFRGTKFSSEAISLTTQNPIQNQDLLNAALSNVQPLSAQNSLSGLFLYWPEALLCSWLQALQIKPVVAWATTHKFLFSPFSCSFWTCSGLIWSPACLDLQPSNVSFG